MQQLARVREALQRANLPAFIVGNLPNVQWLTGFTGSSGLAVVSKDRAAFVTDSRYTIQAREEVEGFELVSFANPTTQADALHGVVSALGVDTVGFERTLTYGTWEDWTQKLGGVRLVPAEDLIAPLRMIKIPDEIAKIREACKLADACMDRALRMVQPGVSEYDIGLDIEFFIRRSGAEIAFAPIVVSGPNSARPHGKPSERKLERGDFVTLDLGATLDGYNSDITRTVVVAEASDRHREIYDRVLRAQLAAIAAIKPGASGKAVDQIARDELGDLAVYFGHGLGHGLGRSVHDAGGLSPTRDCAIEVGQVWTVEPGVYLEGFGGVRIEDDVVVTPDGVEVLTHYPKELLVLG